MTEMYFSKTWSILGYHDTLSLGRRYLCFTFPFMIRAFELDGQPRSQGLSLPAPQSERRETLVGSGHVPPGQIRT